MSAFGGKADIFQGVAECPLLAKSGHPGDGKKSEIFKNGLRKTVHLRKPPVGIVSRICYNPGA